MESNCKLTVTLRQYTPLLHFQGDEEGACLRASEVKPMLDRFVVDYLTRQKADIPGEWIMRNTESDKNDENPHTALRYKMRFEGTPKKTEAHPLYFAGNMGGTAQAVEFPGGVSMKLIALQQEPLDQPVTLPSGEVLVKPTLLSVLERLLPAFFALHCFGTRSNKGFGSFTVEGSSVTNQELDSYKPADCVKLYRLQSRMGSYTPQQCMDDIYVLSGMMKGGFNRPYFKGEIQKSLWNQEIGSDKAFVKQEIFPNETVDRSGRTLLDWYQEDVCNGRDRTHYTKYSSYRYVRGLLGLSDHYTYGVGRNGKSIAVAAQNEDISRFANPVVFKPCENGFLILVYRIPDALYHTAFDFSFRDKKYSQQLPGKDEVDLEAFVSDFLSPLYDPRSRQRHGWDTLKGKTYQYFPSKRRINFDDTLDMLQLVYGRG